MNSLLDPRFQELRQAGMTCLKILIGLMGCLVSAISVASPNSPQPGSCRPPILEINSLTGLADVEWVRRGKAYRLDVAVRIDSPQEASFQAIDDFGNTLFAMHFSGEGEDKVPAIPLSRLEVVAYLLHRWPESTKNVECRYDQWGRLLSVEKKSKKKRKAHLVLFSDFRREGKFSYPHRVEIVDKKGSVKISWKQIDKIR